MIVLIVEDDLGMTQLWSRFLIGISSEVRIAHTIEDAVALMQTVPHPELILLDLRLPGHEAKETLSYVNVFKKINPSAIVIALTGSADESLVELANTFGADAFAFKQNEGRSQRGLLGVIRDSIQKRNSDRDKPIFERSLLVLETLSQAIEKAHNPI